MLSEVNHTIEEKVHTSQKYYWGKDALIVLGVSVAFFIIEVVIGTRYLDKWIVENLMFGRDIFLGLGIWKAIIAVLIVSLFIQKKHYWEWVTVTVIVISLIMNIKMALHLYGQPHPNWRYVTAERVIGRLLGTFLVNSLYVYFMALIVRERRERKIKKVIVKKDCIKCTHCGAPSNIIYKYCPYCTIAFPNQKLRAFLRLCIIMIFVLKIGYILLIPISIPYSLMSVMLFDSPSSPNGPFTLMLFLAMVSYPWLTFLLLLSIKVDRYTETRAWILLNLIPLGLIILGLIGEWGIRNFQNGRL